MRALARWWAPAATLLLAAGLWQVAAAGWIHVKAQVAQQLIERAWSHAERGRPAGRPWPGADLRPVARLVVPQRRVALYVLDNATPRALAFGPAHVGGTALPGAWGNSVIVAHRDTHFAFLKDLAVDDEIDVEPRAGERTRYRVREVAVLDKDETRVLDAADAPQLTLITCFPFDAVLPGTRLRYVVIADRVA